MPPVLGNLIVLAAVALLVRACVRYLVKDARQGGCGGCAGCGGGGACAHCAGCHAACAVSSSQPYEKKGFFSFR